jgi:hypothetical protein
MRTDAHYTRTNENAGLTISAKPASVVAGTTRLELATSGVTDDWKMKELTIISNLQTQ